MFPSSMVTGGYASFGQPPFPEEASKKVFS